MSALGSIATALASELIALASPPRCASCEARVGRRVVFCPACARTIERAPVGLDAAEALFLYGGALSKAITRFKYEDATHLARPLAELLRQARTRLPVARATMVVPVPLHRRRLADRGFNQAALLAAPLARDLGVRLDVRVLERIRDTSRQATLERTERLGNVEQAFAARRNLSGHHVLLVDDVCTTGATLRACSAELTRCGATVCNLVLAITL